MRNLLILFVFFVLIDEAKALQENNASTYYASFRSYISGGKDLPFWIRANQNGAFPVGNNTTQLLRTGFYRNMDTDFSSAWDYFMGGELLTGFAGERYFQPNQYWVGARYRWLVLKAGAEADSICFGGLSSTNGNLDASNNARPVPNISLATNGYVPFPLIGSVLYWKALYSEGVLWDNGYIQNARMHHKNLYFRVKLPGNWNLSTGVEHYVFWGGISPTDGKIATRGEYIYFVSGIRINHGSSPGDGINLPENHLGIYNFEANKRWQNKSLTLYWNHPFENRAGMKMANPTDGLWGISWEAFKNQQYLTGIVYELMNMMDQESFDALSGSVKGNNDYFNDKTYRSGYTHYAQMMGSPLFVPTLDAGGVSTGFRNNQIRMHHIGLKGFLMKNLSWKTMCTFTKNLGSYTAVYPVAISEFSFLSEFNYLLPHLPLQLSTALAGDSGELFEKRVGIYFGIRWEPREEQRSKHAPWVIRKKRK